MNWAKTPCQFVELVLSNEKGNRLVDRHLESVEQALTDGEVATSFTVLLLHRMPTQTRRNHLDA
jgi:hypothetical protein